MDIFGRLCASFLKIGAVGFGGGYAILTLIQHEVVVARAWIGDAAFTDMVALSQVTPGPIAVNAATFLGYTTASAPGMVAALPPWGAGLLGAAIATASVCALPFLYTVVACRAFTRLRHHPRVRQIMTDLRPVVIGLIAAAAFTLLWQTETFTQVWTAAVFAVTLALSIKTEWHPAWLLAGAALVGFLMG